MRAAERRCPERSSTALPGRVAVHPRRRGEARQRAGVEALCRRPEIALPGHAARPPYRRAYGPSAAPGPDRHVRADQGPGSLPDGERLHAPAAGLDGAVVPGDGRDGLAWLADRETPPLLRGTYRGRLAGARSARPASSDPGCHAAPP